MNSKHTRAWGFLHPDLDRLDASKPGIRVSPVGGITMVDGPAAIRQSILLLLSTSPGERVMRPDYGCDLRQLVFSPNDDTTAGLAKHYVAKAIALWEPRVEIVRVDAGRNEGIEDQLLITLEYVLKSTHQKDRLELGIDLKGESN